MTAFFPDLSDRLSDSVFLEKVCRKFHYEKERLEELRAVAEEMLPGIRREAFWEKRSSAVMKERQVEAADRIYEDVIMSLGKSLDDLQESYQERGLLSESYMLEALAGELLLEGYGEYNQSVKREGDWHVARYHFPGSEEDFPLEMVPELLKEFECPVNCNTAFCIFPKKSVVFVAELTQDAQVWCESICEGCHNLHCPNRVGSDPPGGHRFARMADLPMSYGYSRIFGRPYVNHF